MGRTETTVPTSLAGVGQGHKNLTPVFTAVKIFLQVTFLFSPGTSGTAGQEGLTLLNTTIKCPKTCPTFGTSGTVETDG